MLHEISAGIVIYRELKEGREYLLLHYPGGHIDFPKGHLEKGESELEAAYRELQEETGLKEITWIEGFRHPINYVYQRPEGLSSKDVIFFLARTEQKEVKISFEHTGFIWLPYKEAYAKLTFDNAKNVLKNAESFLKKNLGQG